MAAIEKLERSFVNLYPLTETLRCTSNEVISDCETFKWVLGSHGHWNLQQHPCIQYPIQPQRRLPKTKRKNRRLLGSLLWIRCIV